MRMRLDRTQVQQCLPAPGYDWLAWATLELGPSSRGVEFRVNISRQLTASVGGRVSLGEVVSALDGLESGF